MKVSWCTKCKADVSHSLAFSGLPCPNCGSRDYVIIDTDLKSTIEDSDDKAELFMKRGMWEEAEDVYYSNTDYEKSEVTLRMATLQLREECAKHAESFLSEHPSGIAVSSFKQELLDNYDEFVTAWILQDYQGISLIPNGCSYYVKRRDLL